MSSIRDQVALVTGSSRGIGAAIAKSFAQLGAKVWSTEGTAQRYRPSEKKSSSQAAVRCRSVAMSRTLPISKPLVFGSRMSSDL